MNNSIRRGHENQVLSSSYKFSCESSTKQ